MAIKIDKTMKEYEYSYEIDTGIFHIVKKKKLPDYTSLELSKRMYDYTENIFCKEFFNLFKELRTLVENQNNFFAAINTYSESDVQEARFIQQNLEKIKTNAELFESKLNQLLVKKNIEIVKDVIDCGKISREYIKSYFTDNLWFEVFCYYIMLKYIKNKKGTLKAGKDYEIILSQFIKGKQEHQMDLLVFLQSHLTICSAKSGNEGRNHVLALGEIKNDVRADIAILFLFNKYTDKHYGISKSLYIVDAIKEKDYKEIERIIDDILGRLF